MRLLVSWLRDFVDVKASAEEIGEGLGLRGFELAAIEPFGDGDAVIDFEITANRPDCLSVIGLAREVSTLYDLPLKPVRLTPSPAAGFAGSARVVVVSGHPEPAMQGRSADTASQSRPSTPVAVFGCVRLRSHHRRTGIVPAVCGGSRRGHRGQLACLDDDAAAGGRRAVDQLRLSTSPTTC